MALLNACGCQTSKCRKILCQANWPELTNDADEEGYELPIQVNGKLKGLVFVKKEEDEENLIKKAKNLSAVEKALKQKTFIKTIYIPKKILNIVVK